MMRVSGFIGRKVREGGHRTHVKGQVFLKTETIRMFSKDLLDETSLNVCVCCAARGEDFQSESVPGLYPCGEGAGYAGGIISAAGKYSPFHQMQALSMHNNFFNPPFLPTLTGNFCNVQWMA